jgi:CelD/BcsL family acetyltransferase involved in cellulose biosynthesis
MSTIVGVGRAVDPEVWRALLASDPNASFFHTDAWREVLLDVYPDYRPAWFVTEDPDGRTVGALPCIESVRVGLVQRLSLPYGTYATPLAAGSGRVERDSVRAALLNAWWKRALEPPRVVRAHLTLFTPPGGEPLPEWDGSGRATSEQTHLGDLSIGFDRLWSEVYDGDVRTSCRKAERLGVTVETTSDPAGIAELDRLYREQASGWTNHTLFPSGLFEQLCARAPDNVEVWLARQEGQVVAAQLLLLHEDTVLSWLAPNRPEARRLNAPTFLYRTIMESIAGRGFRWFNFGGSRQAPGLEKFKQDLGGRPHDYSVCLREAAWFRPLHRLQYRLRGIRE